MKKILILTGVISCAVFNGDHARAEMNYALGCLQASAQSGGLARCLNESGKSEASPVLAGKSSSWTETPDLSVTPLDAGEEKRTRIVPTPTGYTSAEDGTLKAGFYSGLDSGFKTAFMTIEYLPILGMEAFGAPNMSSPGAVAFMAVGVLLAIPASIIGVVLGAPLGAAAGMIAEKVSPGSTDDWFTF